MNRLTNVLTVLCSCAALMLIAGLVAVPVFFRHQIARVVRAVRGKQDATEPATGTDDASDRT